MIVKERWATCSTSRAIPLSRRAELRMSASFIAIIGGGVSGLAAAYELSQCGVPFVLYERALQFGGMIRTERVRGHKMRRTQSTHTCWETLRTHACSAREHEACRARDGAILVASGVVNAMEALEMRDFPRTTAKNPATLRVLVVDDEPLIRWSVAETLADRGYEIVETGDARGARSAIQAAEEAFDVVLLDYRLPDSDDLGLLASLRSLSPKTQIILMTAFGRPEVVRGALDLGAYRVISKPFEMQAIADLVTQAHDANTSRETH